MEDLQTQLEQRIHKIYQQASKEMTEKLKQMLKDYERKAQKNKEIMTDEEYAEWRRRRATEISNLLNKQEHLAKMMVEADQVATEAINSQMPLVYGEGYNHGTYQVESVGNVNTMYTLYDADTVERLIKEQPELLPKNLKVNIPKDLKWNQQHITSAITQGIIQGESMDKIARRLIGVVGMDERAAIRNARTATNGAQNAGRLNAYKRGRDMGIDVKKKWLATYDNRTRHSHAVIDGEKVGLDDEFSNGCMCPGDPNGPPGEIWNCRCTLIPVVNGEDDDSWKDNVLVGDKGYEAWKEEHRQALEKRESETLS